MQIESKLKRSPNQGSEKVDWFKLKKCYNTIIQDLGKTLVFKKSG